MILNIDTSCKICSVALSEGVENVYTLESENEMEHSTMLAPYVEKCLDYINERNHSLEAVAVSTGPGSYTGLRIGLSLAKGLCFSRNIPLIGISTLEILAVKGMFAGRNIEGDEFLIPMIDARRMEVYTAVYNTALEEIMAPTPLILTEDSFRQYEGRKLIFVGDGVKKAENLLKIGNSQWLETYPLAKDMSVLSYKAFINQQFADIAYSVPVYLKNFQATTPKSRL